MTTLNMGPMCHIAHLRNKLKSINTFEQSSVYIITIRRGNKTLSPFWELNGPCLSNPESPSLKDTLCRIWFCSRRFFKFCGPSKIPFTQCCFVPSLVEIGEEKLKKKFNVFRYIVIISPWKKVSPILFKN